MTGQVQSKPAALDGTPASAAPRPHQRQVNLFEVAYDRLEEMIVNCSLRPGQLLSIQELQDMTGLSRTPVHQAVRQLSHDTLIVIRPRNGIQIAPIDLARQRTLLQLRKDVESFVIRLAAERSGPTQKNQMLHLNRAMRERRGEMDIDEFNKFDRRIDRLILSAAGEPFLQHTLRPLHTLFRRTGWLHHRHIAGHSSLERTIECHLAVVEAVANGRIADAVASSDALMAFVEDMLGAMELQMDPALLDISLEPLVPA
jgi:DNA-binding GntR family transcriptional regulator